MHLHCSSSRLGNGNRQILMPRCASVLILGDRQYFIPKPPYYCLLGHFPFASG
jgi:hypothetical protein